MAKLKAKLLQIVYGELIVVIATVAVAYAFFDSSALTVIRSVGVVAAAFLLMYAIWIKMNKSYEKIYKSGLRGTK